MKLNQIEHDADGKLKNGVFKEFFKDGTLACVGKYRKGESRRVEVLPPKRSVTGGGQVRRRQNDRRMEMVPRKRQADADRFIRWRKEVGSLEAIPSERRALRRGRIRRQQKDRRMANV